VIAGEVLAEELASVLGGDRHHGMLCEALARLLQELIDGQAGWDSRFAWIDGIVPLDVRIMSPSTLRLVGAAHVVNGTRRTLRPVHAELALPPETSRLHVASADAEVLYSRRRGDRLVIPPHPEAWPHAFHITLAGAWRI
jgi:hypothetical protein